MKRNIFTRLLSLLMVLCMIAGMVPTVGVLRASAEDTTAAEITALQSTLNSSFSSLSIPKNKFVSITSSNVGSLDGTYFMVAISKTGKRGLIDFSNRQSGELRLTNNCISETAAKTGYYYDGYLYNSKYIYPASDNSIFWGNANNLDYAVELTKYTASYSGTSAWETTMSESYNYTAKRSGGEKFGTYLDIASIPAYSDPGYSIKSLHPDVEGAPFLVAGQGVNLGTSASRFPWYFIPNNANIPATSTNYKPLGRTTKIYKRHTTSGTSYFLGWDVHDSDKPYRITLGTIYEIVREDRNIADGYAAYNPCQFYPNWEFYHISPETLELYKALVQVQSYVTNGVQDHDPELYLGFLQDVQEAMTYYNAHRATYNAADATENEVRATAERLALDIIAYAELLDIEAAGTANYMDIPMEVLDFRADGFMFEDWDIGTAYSLTRSSTDLHNGVLVPGNLLYDVDGNYYRTGLIEENLVDGQIVYTEATITYIANALHLQHHTFDDPAASSTGNYRGDFGTEDMDTYYNSAFMNWADPIESNRADSEEPDEAEQQPLGSFAATIAKTDTGANGGILPYNQVATCFDMAYYICTNIWRQTAADDVVETVTKDGTTYNLPYNVKINELHTMRLIKNSSGDYVFASDYANGRNLDTGLIYNYPDFASSGDRLPTLNAAAGLGFEHEDMLGWNSTGIANETASGRDMYGDSNYHVVYHMESAFVYYESKDLYFNFSGDDDVYFFVNGHLICDIGGMHPAASRGVALNDVADELGLEDGDICTFDMFLAERHTFAINLNLTTNIEMMSAEAVTEKVQYKYEGYAETGTFGEEIAEGSFIEGGTEIGYGFKLLNRSEYGATDLSFRDEILGVTISGAAVELKDFAEVEELTLIYRTHNPNTSQLYDATANFLAFEDLTETLRAAVDNLGNATPLTEGVYRISGLTEDQIMELMRIGLPANVQIAIYGLHRTAVNPIYVNTVHTSCRPIESRKEDNSYNYGTTIIGSATRTVNVQMSDAVTAQPLRIVLDYGKPVEFTQEDLDRCLNHRTLDASVTFMGICTGGKHGGILDEAPDNLSLTANGQTLATANGVYDRAFDTFRFTPTGMLEDVDTVYAVYKATDYYLQEQEAVHTWYLLVGIYIIPATMMYYEAEDLLDHGLSLEERYTEDEEEHFNYTPQIVSDGVANEPVINAYDPTNDENVIYFGFDNTEEDQARYASNPVYGGKNFDEAGNWWRPTYVNEPTIEDGALTFVSTASTNLIGYVATGGGEAGDANSAEFPLYYTPSEDDWCEVRLKIDGATPASGENLAFRVELIPAKENAIPNAKIREYFPVSYVDNGYFTLKFAMNTGEEGHPTDFTYTDVELVRRINLIVQDVTAGISFTTSIDYFYIGPEETCPSNLNKDFLYFGFDDTAADQYRYDNPIYGSRHNFDKTPTASTDDWLYTDTRTPALTVSDGAMNVTCGAFDTTPDDGENTNSPWLQTSNSDTVQAMLDFPVSRAEVASLRIKFSNMTTNAVDVSEDEDSSPVARLAFVLDGYETMEASSCWIDFPLTEEQLNGSDYLVFTGEISELLAEKGAQKITAIRLTILNAASMEDQPGTFSVDYIYVGPEYAQDLDSYVPASEKPVESLPVPVDYTPTYDDRVIYFGFDGTTEDGYRYGSNPVYGGNDYDVVTNDGSTQATWWTNTANTATPTITDGNLKITGASVASTTEVYVQNSLNGGAASYKMKYSAENAEYIEIRMRLEGVTYSGTPKFRVFLLLDNAVKAAEDTTCAIYWYNIPTEYYTNGEYFTATIPTAGNANLEAAEIINSLRINIIGGSSFNPDGSGSARSAYIDYIYVGPEETLPSRLYPENDHLYFGFENDANAEYKYGSALYGGVNFDNATHWRFNTNRSVTPTISDGQMSYTIAISDDDAGNHWFEIAKKSSETSRSSVLEYDPDRAEILQIRMKFEGLTARSGTGASLKLLYNDVLGTWTSTTDIEADKPMLSLPITAEELAADGKWHTYTFELTDDHRALAMITGLRFELANVIQKEGSGTLTVDYIYVGPDIRKTSEVYRSDEDYTYGHDEVYSEDISYSNHQSLFVEGKGIEVLTNATDYTTYSFDFKGTGFDIISRTGADQGSIRVSVYSDEEKTNLVKHTQAINKGITELTQVPVVSIEGLTYGQYYVDIYVAEPYDYGNDGNSDTFGGALDRGGEFYFDAIRIYDPVNTAANSTSAKIAYEAYCLDGEANYRITELRQYIIDANTFVPGSSMEGMLYLDDAKNSEEGGVTVGTYSSVGPNNETYLQPGNLVAFKLVVNGTMPESIDLGVKSVDGTPVTLGMYIGNEVPTSVEQITDQLAINSSTAMYYPIDVTSWVSVEDTHYTYVMLYNAGENGTISLTDLKVGYSGAVTQSDTVSLMIDADIFAEDTGANLVFHSASLSLESDLSMNFFVAESTLSGYTDSFVRFSKAIYGEDGSITGYEETTVKSTFTKTMSDGTVCYGYVFDGINATEMNSEITATLGAYTNGRTPEGVPLTYNPKQYATNMLAKDVSEELNTLLVDMLNYGAAAQTYFEYNTANLANADLTEEQKTMASTKDLNLIDELSNVANEAETVEFDGATLLLEEKVEMNFYLDVSSHAAGVEDLYAIASFADLEGNQVQISIDGTEFVSDENGSYAIHFDGLNAAQMRTIVSVTVYSKETAKPTSETLQYSIQTYAYNFQNYEVEILANLVKNMVYYGDSVYTYANKQ